jgi:predicted nucleotidyltransferase
MDLPAPVERLAEELAAVPGVAAVALTGSRATGVHRPESDWDLSVYYRGSIDPDGLRALGYEGYVSGVGEWGPIMNGGGWLTSDGIPVDVLYRDLDTVERWLVDAEQGRFEVLMQNGSLAGAPTYGPVGELAVARPISGRLPRPVYPGALAEAAPGRWRGRAQVALLFAEKHGETGDAVCCAGMLAQAVLCVAHARLAERREWVVGEKRLVERAGLAAVQPLLTDLGDDLRAAVDGVAGVLGVEPLAAR